MKPFRHLALALSLCVAALAATAQNAAPQKVLRYAFLIAETGFDPAQINDLYSRNITSQIFEAMYSYDHLARPAKIKPLTAAGLPQVSDDFRTWTIRLQPGILFPDDPAFKGRRRELTAQDYVYSLKRFADPRWKSPGWASLEEAQLIGLAELREKALKERTPFDYDREIEGVRALDRYTLQFKLKDPRPRFLEENLADSGLTGAVAREVVEYYGEHIMEHPVGTGAFRLAAWRRSSLIVLERNPAYREVHYDAEPAPDDAQGQALLKRFKGRRLPMIDRVEISIIEESQPRWLAFLNGEADFMDRVPPEFAAKAVPNGKLAPNLAKQHIQLDRTVAPDETLLYFNMEDPIVGGYTPEKVALRRAISLSYDVAREIRLVRGGHAIPAQSPIVPGTYGYEPGFKSENSDFDPARAKALLDLYGYVDKDGDGWRDMPDGSPLVLRMATEPDNTSRQYNDLWRIAANRIGLRIEFAPAKWPENMKSARAGKLMMWLLGSSADAPDGQGALARWYGPSAGAQNLARFKRPEFDALYERMQVMPNGPERLKLFEEAKRLTIAWAPYKIHVHRIYNDLSQPWLVGYRRPVFWNDWWQYVDIDVSKRPTKLAP
jgi:ABC-type transport system substrate-binding protein